MFFFAGRTGTESPFPRFKSRNARRRRRFLRIDVVYRKHMTQLSGINRAISTIT